MNENVLAATTQMFFAIFLHSVSECCIFAAPKILPLGIANQKKVFFCFAFRPLIRISAGGKRW